MATIKIMDQMLANKIAAGEVVERPSSVVKELVENALDAKATKIDIYLEEAGIQSITVIDNGKGMNEEDALLAFERHATSKLIDEQMLFRINTLGFRGEALPSIASVSDLTLKTSTGEDAGTFIHIRGGRRVETSRTDARKGTEISVNNLFFNTPARLKYLKSINTELGYTVDFINKIAISHANVAFRLVHDGRVLLQSNGNGNLLNIIASIYGVDVAKRMREADYEDSYMSIKLFYGEPEIYRTSRNYITLVVNERVVKNYDLIKSICEGYEGYLPIGKYPVVVLAITIDPLLIDVNVHPAKLEIRFSNHAELKTILTDLIRKQLKAMLAIPKVKFPETRREKNDEEQQFFDFKGKDENPFSDYQEKIRDRSESNNGPKRIDGVDFSPQIEEPLIIADEDASFEFNYIDERVIEPEEKQVDELKRDLPKLDYIGQLMGTYLLAQNEKGLYLIDQHAAEERINYEYYLHALSQAHHEYYELLVPETFEFSLNESLTIEKRLEDIEGLGIGIEKFGLKSYIISKMPLYLNQKNDREYLEKIFQHILDEKPIDRKSLFKDLAVTLGCKRSIKANHFINDIEVQTLLDRLILCEDPYRCPHGRPVVIHLSKEEIEHLFKRTV